MAGKALRRGRQPVKKSLKIVNFSALFSRSAGGSQEKALTAPKPPRYLCLEIMKKPAVLLPAFFALLCSSGPALASGDPYRLLGVLPGHTSKEVDRAFQQIKFQIHPGRHGGSQEAKERFQELREAYDSLKDPDFRTRYDGYLRESGKNIQAEPNLYKILGVLSGSSSAELTRAYRKLRMRLHPDRHEGSRLANERFKELQEAHRTLLDPALRARHDRILKGAGGVLTHEKGAAAAAPAKQPKKEDFERSAAELPKRRMETEAIPEEAAFAEEIFQLARELEKSGGEEDLKEAVQWHRMLARENHLKAAFHLASLLESSDIKEALYRYRQAAAEGADNDLARASVFRQAQIYQAGFSKDGKEIIPADSARAAELYERAFHLGSSPQDIAAEYDRLENYEEAIKWRLAKPGSSGGKAVRTNQEGKSGEEELQNLIWKSPVKASFPDDSDIHIAIRHQDFADTAHYEKEERVLAMARDLVRHGADISAGGHNERSPLSLAIWRHYFRAAAWLIERGADVNIPDRDGDLPLHNALMAWDLSNFYIEFEFLNAGVMMKRSYSAALSGKDIESMRQILFSLVEKTDLSFRNKRGWLPLYLALKKQAHSETAQLILQKMKGERILTERERGQLLRLAINGGHREAVSLLKQAAVRKDIFTPSSWPSAPGASRPARLFNACRVLFVRRGALAD